MSKVSKVLNVALLQLKVSPVKHENYTKVTALVNEALSKRPNLDLVVLPECFNSPYSIKLFRKYCEPIPNGETTQFLQQLSREKKVNIIGGSIPEEADGGIYNTSTVFNADGEIIAKHQKLHLFDVDIPNKISFQESRVLKAGNKTTVFNLPSFGNVGLGVCYDLRFPEVAHQATRPPYNSFLMCYPGAFNLTTGPVHWEPLARARAIDNQCFVILCSPARDLDAKYHAYGHSLIVNPMGKVLVEADSSEQIVYGELRLDEVDEFRQNVPLQSQRRFDVYSNVSENGKIGDV